MTATLSVLKSEFREHRASRSERIHNQGRQVEAAGREQVVIQPEV